jgi:hypothetical protein
MARARSRVEQMKTESEPFRRMPPAEHDRVLNQVF